jgi:putative glutamine amidotransferase
MTVLLWVACNKWTDISGSAISRAEMRTKRTVILVTHPSKRVLHRMVTLADQGLLAVNKLRVVGLIHADEWGSYSRAEEYAAAHDWLTLERLVCPLSPETLFQRNACTPHFERLISGSAGIIFTGGPDIPPAIYGEQTQLTTVIESPRRQYYELSLLYHLLGRGEGSDDPPLLAGRLDYPVLAICMGMQEMNVATGGTLVQDIPSDIYERTTLEQVLAQPEDEVHRNAHRLLDPEPGVAWGVFHALQLRGDSVLSELAEASDRLVVMSAHHQSLNKLGFGLRVIATSTDGRVIEAVEHERFPHVLGVQFHPDFFVLWDGDAQWRLKSSDPPGNFAAETMARDPASRDFNRGIWKVFSRWVNEHRRER